jgi:hypothetical protein
LLALRVAGASDDSAEERARLRAVAAEFPGALRELDTLPTDELTRRAEALEAAAAGGLPALIEPWMIWLDGFHATLRAALAVKSAQAQDAAPDRAAIARDTGVDVDDAFVAAVAAPPHGRLLVVVFDRLAVVHGLPARTLWDALIPPRKGPRAYRDR